METNPPQTEFSFFSPPGLAFLDRALFTTYTYNPIQSDARNETTIPETATGTGADDEALPAAFQISLPALLETLQIFGVDAAKSRWSRDPSSSYDAGVASFATGAAAAFDRRLLGLAGLCRLSYPRAGAPFQVILEETGVRTTCELVTYEAEFPDEIPLQRDRLAQKIIMRAAWLQDAILELGSLSPTKLTLEVSPTGPAYLALSSVGPFGSATVEFSKDPQLLETFQVARRTSNTYKFALIKNALRAMSIASKVSIRGDEQGVLSLQFMVEFDGGGISFVDYRFVPFLSEEEEGGGETQSDREDEWSQHDE